MIDIVNSLFGDVGTLDYEIHQLFLRTIVVYIFTIFLIRIGEKRFIGEHAAFDFIIAIMLGSILSQVIVDSFTFINGLLIGFFLVIIHFSFAKIAYFSSRFGNLIKGNKFVLIRDGKLVRENMRKSSISKQDLISALRRDGNTEDPKEVKLAILERNGMISVIKY